MSDDDKDTSVRVAVRIRPQIPRELIDMCRMCTEVTPGEPQIILGTDKAFTFDYVFDVHTNQGDVYSTCVERLIEGALKGYNATVLAYGQTGSGKTYTMGTGFDRDIEESFEGIIPRAVRHLFSGIQALQENPYDENGQYLGSIQFSVAAQFMELYNEEIIDLLDPFSKGRVFKIHEDSTGAISVSGVTIRPLQGPTDALRCLQQGALARTTASTNMNEQSSRSHAIFTILIRRQRVMPGEDGEDDLETLSSKFHFVDLAGSERLKRTGATGERAREGISINCGLLALGNVISALGDVTKKATHVPYRDSKLTRLLQDSLGGNSDSLLIACISPSDRDFCETLNTLKYANRARNIKNKVQINQDSSSRTISQLRAQIANLQMEILEYKQGKRSVDSEGNAQISDTSLENAMLLADNKRLQQRLKAMSETINTLTEKNTVLLSEKTIASWGDQGAENGDQSIAELVAKYINEIEKLKAKLIESEQMYQQLKKQMSSSPQKNLRSNNSYVDEVVSENPTEIINLAKRELEKEREILMSRSLPGVSEDSQIAGDGDGDGSDNDSEDSDTESDDKAVELQDEINDIQSDIEIKTKLIEQLELSQKRMQVMKHHYEEKLAVLTARIASTQKERDQVLSNMNKSSIGMDPEQPSKIKKVRDEYEKKLTELQKEMRKLQQAQKEHVRQQRELQAQDAQLKLLRSELSDLKQIKIKLMKKMSEENSRHKEEESRKQREIAQLRKEARKQTNMIKSLQAQGAAKDQVLKRKTEEVSALRKSQKNALSLKAQGRVPAKRINANYHPRQARLKWDEMQRIISKTARSKHAVIELERELERLMQEREQLSRDLAIIKRRQKLQNNLELDSEEDSIQANLNYIQENITQVQHSIMDLEEGKESATEQLSLQNMLESVKNVEEAKYLIEKLYTSSISQSCDVGVIQSRLKEKEALLTEVQQDSNIQQQLLQHVLARNPNLNDLYSDGNISTLNFLNTSDTSRNLDVTLNSITSTHSSRSTSPNNSEMDVQNTRTKVRKRAAHAQELLFGDVDMANGNGNNKQDMSQSVVQEGRSFVPLTRIPSAPGSLKGLLPVTYSRQNSLASPMVTRKFDPPPPSPKITRRPLPKPGLDENETPGSPIVYRRQVSREETDVFSRLGAGSFRDDLPGGSIRDFNGKAKTGSPLICTHVVEGHRSPVLAIKVYECNLFTGAAEGNLKVWDLRKNDSPACLPHQAPVVAVEYDMKTRTLFSASGSFIKIWDLRESNIKPLKTLNCESPITALTLGASGNLYSACSDKVRFWDLRTFSCLGKLSGGLQSGIVMCITAWEGPGNTDFIATGSKDHYVKVFEVPTKSTNTVLPLLNLEPPHYDGVQALAVAKDAFGVDAELFSGSRDSGIKRWDLKNGELKQSLNNCHKSWVSGMCCNGDVLLSSCRGGIIRLWNVKNCDALAEMKTDSSINDITCSDNRIFTASGSGECRIWRFSSDDICNFTNRSSINKINKK